MIWNLIAKFCARPAVADWLIRRADKNPYIDIYNNGVLYMRRGWIFNPYNLNAKKTLWQKFMSHLPSARVHHIVKEDDARHHHSHPWRARTCILRDWYKECRLEKDGVAPVEWGGREVDYVRSAGDTATLEFDEYHTITEVAPGGVYTLFITWKYQGTWGFLVDGVKVPWKKYLNVE